MISAFACVPFWGCDLLSSQIAVKRAGFFSRARTQVDLIATYMQVHLHVHVHECYFLAGHGQCSKIPSKSMCILGRLREGFCSTVLHLATVRQKYFRVAHTLLICDVHIWSFEKQIVNLYCILLCDIRELFNVRQTCSLCPCTTGVQ